ncbi:MAG: hypothetical protein E6357_26245 [Clostridiales bacterium]|nr:hypothetical protein [Clostridiales bacterium]
MIKFEVIGGLPFYTPVRNIEEFMTVGELVEGLIYMKEKYDIGYPDDDYINLACNLLDKLPKDGNVGVLLAKSKFEVLDRRRSITIKTLIKRIKERARSEGFTQECAVAFAEGWFETMTDIEEGKIYTAKDILDLLKCLNAARNC